VWVCVCVDMSSVCVNSVLPGAEQNACVLCHRVIPWWRGRPRENGVFSREEFWGREKMCAGPRCSKRSLYFNTEVYAYRKSHVGICACVRACMCVSCVCVRVHVVCVCGWVGGWVCGRVGECVCAVVFHFPRCILSHTHTQTHTHTHTNTHSQTHTHTHAPTQTNTNIHTHTHTHTENMAFRTTIIAFVACAGIM